MMGRNWLDTGVLYGDLNSSLVYGDSSGMQVKVKSGRAWVDGFFFQDDAAAGDTALAIAAADPSNPRIDLVVLRLDHTIPSIAYQVITGTAAASPATPTPTQTVGGRWELPLAVVWVPAAAATITAANVGDRRAFARMANTRNMPEQNLLINPGYEYNQRATTYTTTGLYTLDQWLLTLATSTATISQITSTVGAGGNSVQVAYTHGGGGSARLEQKVETVLQLRGQLVTFAATVKSTVNGTIRLRINDGTTTTTSSYNVGVGSQRLFVTATVGAAATTLTVGLLMDVATATAEANDATLVTGGIPADYVPLPGQADLARCQRYYEVHGGVLGACACYAYNAAGAPTGIWVPFAVPKGGTPTMTKAGTWQVTNCGQPGFGGTANTVGYLLSTTATALGAVLFQCNSSDDTIVAEYNP